MNERRNRGVRDILIAVVDGLKGFPEAITAAFPETTVQTCIVHLIRHSMNFCRWKDRKAVAADLRPIYEAPTAEEAARQLNAFEEKWAGTYPSIAPAWRRAWAEVTPFHAFSAAIRTIIHTTNAAESLNRPRRGKQSCLREVGYHLVCERHPGTILVAFAPVQGLWGRPHLRCHPEQLPGADPGPRRTGQGS